MSKQIEKLEKIKDYIKNPEFKEAVQNKIDKIKQGSKINKDGH